MKKLTRKAAIELSMNFIVVIIISIVVFAGGLGLFFKMSKSAQQTVSTLDSQTAANIKSMMLSNNYRTAVYPQDAVITNGDAALFGVGITNIYDETYNFTVSLKSVMYYSSPGTGGQDKPSLAEYHDITSNGKIELAPHAQGVKEILLKMPKASLKGEYVYTIKIVNGTNTDSYGTLQVYVKNK